MSRSFVVRYFDKERACLVEEEMRGDNEAQLRQQLQARGRVPLQLRAARSGPAGLLRRVDAFDVAWWCRELQTLLVAGMTVVEALETMHAQTGQDRGQDSRQAVNEALLKALREGWPLSRAMDAAGAFPKVLVASVTASERTSTLPEALRDFLQYDEMLQRLRRQVVSAAIYPALVIGLGLLISGFLLVFVMPRFSRIYVDYPGALSTPTRLLLGFSGLIREHALLLAAALAVLLLAVAWAWRASHVKTLALQMLEGLGPLQRQLKDFRLAKLYQSLALMFRGGYTLDEALRVCEGLSLGPQVTQGVVAARAELARGRAVATALADAALTDPVSQRLLAVGERMGGFAAVLQTIADRHATAFGTFVERATRIVEPVLLLLVALLVGGIVVMMYLPIFDIASGIR